MIKLNPLTGNFDDVGFPARTITGTANQVTVTNGDGVSGNPTLSLPQDIHTGASPTFAQMTLAATTPYLYTKGDSWMGWKGVNSSNQEKFFYEYQQSSKSFYLTITDAAGADYKEIWRGVHNTGGTAQFKISANTYPATDSLYTNGTSSLYWSNTYTDRLYLNSTAYLDGGTAGTADLTGKLVVRSTAEAQLDFNSNSSAQTFRLFARDSDDSFGLYDVTNSRTFFRFVTSASSSGQTLSLMENTGGGGGLLGLAMSGTTAPTHTLTLGSGSTGIALYNTADQTTNYERLRMYYSSNVFQIESRANGTGVVRSISISVYASNGLRINDSFTSSGHIQSTLSASNVNAIIHKIDGTLNASSGVQYGLSIAPTFAQSSTAGYTALLINPTETATGSGTKLLIDAQVGGTSKFKVDNTGTPELGVSGGGIVMKSPDGTRYRVTVANGGTIAVAAA